MGLYDLTLGRFSKDLGIDLGTANTVVYMKSLGIVLREPSIVAIEKNSSRVVAIGQEAKRMVGRTPGGIVAIRPMRDGVIADFDIVEGMLRSFIKRVIKRSRFIKPRIIIGVPSGITAVERRAVVDASMKAGAKETFLVTESMAAAIGSNFSIFEPQGNMIIDIGGGTTEVAVIALGGIVESRSIRVAGDEMDQAIMAHCRRNYNLLIGERTAEEIKIEIGSAYPMPVEKTMDVKGRDLVSGLPKYFTLSSAEVRDTLSEPVNTITDAIRMTLEKIPPELSSDLMEKGMVMTGGGSLLYGLDKYIAQETEMKVTVAEDPLSSVAYGTGKILEDMTRYKGVLMSSRDM
ncbi:MAG: rod shape-determining protein [Candidatus Margulisiibacteriota bacterium]|jgi:rod shape-determining protein MreB